MTAEAQRGSGSSSGVQTGPVEPVGFEDRLLARLAEDVDFGALVAHAEVCKVVRKSAEQARVQLAKAQQEGRSPPEYLVLLQHVARQIVAIVGSKTIADTCGVDRRLVMTEVKNALNFAYWTALEEEPDQ